MIKVTTKHGATNISADGNATELTADVLCIVRALYFGLKDEKHDKAAEKFKRSILEMMPTTFKDEEDIHKIAEDHVKDVLDMLKDINGVLKSLTDESEDEDENEDEE